jgi:hypothetical protein
MCCGWFAARPQGAAYADGLTIKFGDQPSDVPTGTLGFMGGEPLGPATEATGHRSYGLNMSYYHIIARHQGLRKIEAKSEIQGIKLADMRRELSEVQTELRNMQLVNRAYLELISEHIELRQEDVELRLQELLAADEVATPCGQCKRPMSKSGGNCRYCGAAPE